MSRTPRPVAWSRVAALLTVLVTGAAHAQTDGARDGRPTIMATVFDNAAIYRDTTYDFEPLSVGVPDMLLTDLAASSSVRVVDRQRLNEMLKEQNLSASDHIDRATAVRVGKLLGARYMLWGVVFIQGPNAVEVRVALDDLETGVVIPQPKLRARGKVDDILGIINQLGAKIAQELQVPAAREPRTGCGARGSKANDLRAVILLGRALTEQDKGNVAGAIARYRDALALAPQCTHVKTLLASLEGTGASTP
jgi:TolB-like protein